MKKSKQNEYRVFRKEGDPLWYYSINDMVSEGFKFKYMANQELNIKLGKIKLNTLECTHSYWTKESTLVVKDNEIVVRCLCDECNKYFYMKGKLEYWKECDDFPEDITNKIRELKK